jgi:hypothetical protein
MNGWDEAPGSGGRCFGAGANENPSDATQRETTQRRLARIGRTEVSKVKG